MRSFIKVSLILFATLIPVIASAQTPAKFNTHTQLNWPKVTGSGAPSNSCTSANYGEPYTNVASTPNVQYVCSSLGWLQISSSSGVWHTGIGAPSQGTASTITHVQSRQCIPASSCAYTSNVTVGNLLMVYEGGESGMANNLTPTDTIGTTYTLVGYSGGFGTIVGAVYVGYAPSSGADTVSWTSGVATNPMLGVDEFTNVSTHVDVASTYQFNAASPSISVTPNVAGDLLVGFASYLWTSGYPSSYTPSSGFSLGANTLGSGLDNPFAVIYDQVAGTSATAVGVTQSGNSGSAASFGALALYATHTGSVGTDGDFYVDTITGRVYGPRNHGLYFSFGNSFGLVTADGTTIQVVNGVMSTINAATLGSNSFVGTETITPATINTPALIVKGNTTAAVVPSVVQSKTNGQTMTVAAGDAIFVYCEGSGTPTDSGGDTFTLIQTDVGWETAYAWVAFNVAAQTTGIGGCGVQDIILDIAGTHSVNAFNHTQVPASTDPWTGSITTTVPSLLVLANGNTGRFVQNPAGATVSAGWSPSTYTWYTAKQQVTYGTSTVTVTGMGGWVGGNTSWSGIFGYYAFAGSATTQTADLVQNTNADNTVLSGVKNVGLPYETPITYSALTGYLTCSSGVKGTRARITDSTVNTGGSTIAGSGSYLVPAVCNGTNWVVDGGSGGIAALTGDVSASGTGSVAATLATVNSGPGSCGDSTHVCEVTTNGKGLVTAQTAVAIAGGGSSGGIAALTGDVSASGTGSVAATLATVNSGPGSCGDSTHVCEVTTNGKGLVTAQTAVAIAGGGSTVASLPPYEQIGSTLYIPTDSMSTATLPPSSPTWLNGVAPTSVVTGANGNQVATSTLATNTIVWESQTATSSVEAVITGSTTTPIGSGTYPRYGIWLYDSTNSKVYFFEVFLTSPSTTTMLVGLEEEIYTYSGTGVPAYSSTPKQTALGYGFGTPAHLKLAVSAGTLTFEYSIDGGVTWIVFNTQSVGTISKGGYGLGGYNNGTTLTTVANVLSLAVI